MSSSLRALVLVLALVACHSEPLQQGNEAPVSPPQVAVSDDVSATAPTKVEEAAEVKEVVFDPAKPPPGYSRCQAKECHTKDGRILTYKQVMAEIGAVRMAGGLDTAKLPAAPKDVAAVPPDAVTHTSGLASRVLKAGAGQARPSPSSRVLVHYSGWTTDGKAFDSSVARGRPSAFPLEKVIPGWQEALQMMVVGEQRRGWVPESLAYKGQAGGPAGMLVFDLELVRILDKR